ncbi:unnamed protein product [Ambrosiozyma monospora]|uniref:Unnamed protein product n=1 Tax=Ambrosiozyma monospora TaxID=43982 RepID=A0ACB5TTR0_AMBMO|nr:unnamed protein product [Ambrosiozyma monospora]
MIFLFYPVELGCGKNDRFNYLGFTPQEFKDAFYKQSNFVKGTDAWSTVFIENHDQPRSISRFGDDSTPELRNISGKMIATLESTLSGTMFIYEGQEIGATNVPASWDISEYKDVNTINYWNAFLKTNPSEEEKAKLLKVINLMARDNARTPMLWDDSKNGGFSTGEPWMRVNDNYKEVNAAKERADPNSIYNYYKKALQIRKEYRDVLVHGDFDHVDYENNQIMSYTKTGKDRKAYVVLNLTKDTVKFTKQVDGDLKLILSNYSANSESELQPFESRVYLIDA